MPTTRSLLIVLLTCLLTPFAHSQAAPPILAAVPTASSSTLLRMNEVEANDQPAQANPLIATQIQISGTIYPDQFIAPPTNIDLDYFKVTVNQGDRLFAAIITAFSAGSSNSQLSVIAPDGTTVLETDQDDGVLSDLGSSIAGFRFPTSGTYYLRLASEDDIASSKVGSIRSYTLYVSIAQAGPSAESEPNAPSAPQALPATHSVSGALSTPGDEDAFWLELAAGATLFASLDLDPERDNITWDGRIVLQSASGTRFIGDNIPASQPNSEAFVITVRAAGRYALTVDMADKSQGSPQHTYALRLAMLDAKQYAGCHTYASASVPQPLGPGLAIAEASITVPDNLIIEHLSTTLAISHTLLHNLDIVLRGPQLNHAGLVALNQTTTTTLDLILDEDAAYPINALPDNLTETIVQPDSSHRLSWFNGSESAGTWTLQLAQRQAGGSGVLQHWAITICGRPADAPLCAYGAPKIFHQADFETGPSMYAGHWELGVPANPPLIPNASGSQSWATNLTGPLQPHQIKILDSQRINLPGLEPDELLFVQWRQSYQLRSAQTNDIYTVIAVIRGQDSVLRGGTIFDYFGPAMQTTLGTASIPEHVAWSQTRIALPTRPGDDSVLLSFQVVSHLATQPEVAGLAIDDVLVFACSPAAARLNLPIIIK